MIVGISLSFERISKVGSRDKTREKEANDLVIRPLYLVLINVVMFIGIKNPCNRKDIVGGVEHYMHH